MITLRFSSRGRWDLVNGSLKNASNVLIGVGAGIVIEKPVDDYRKTRERIKRIQENLDKMASLGQKIQCDAEELSHKTQQMMEEAQR
jgi:prefoldin subunit 5